MGHKCLIQTINTNKINIPGLGYITFRRPLRAPIYSYSGVILVTQLKHRRDIISQISFADLIEIISDMSAAHYSA
jgi:hypothetical protein